MGYYIGRAGYYEGDKQDVHDEDVDRRPDAWFDRKDKAWVENTNLKPGLTDAEKLQKLLLYIAGKPETPQDIKALNG